MLEDWNVVVIGERDTEKDLLEVLEEDGEREVISEIPRKVTELDKLLGIDAFPKMMRS